MLITTPKTRRKNKPKNTPADVIAELSVDNLIFGLNDNKLKVLLIKHGEGLSEGHWGLPGGWVKYSESLEDAAARILFELSGINNVFLEQLQTFSGVNRYPTRRVISAAYYVLIRPDKHDLVAGDVTLDATWFDIKKLPKLIFDHKEIVNSGIKFLKHKIRHEPIGFNLLPKKFTLLELQELYEAILDVTLDKPNFRRKMTKMDLLLACNEKKVGGAHRAANLYRFNIKNYN
ncbi:MAG: NUDIX hydrolase, partial [Spongiibacteraceae bacterium]|nr:NUDIX hydrolase [Spongiibacteraceae bacterium]